MVRGAQGGYLTRRQEASQLLGRALYLGAIGLERVLERVLGPVQYDLGAADGADDRAEVFLRARTTLKEQHPHAH